MFFFPTVDTHNILYQIQPNVKVFHNTAHFFCAFFKARTVLPQSGGSFFIFTF